MIDTKDVAKLRAESGFGVMECKKALDEAKGDYEKALLIVKKQGKVKAEKKADREIKNGVVEAYVHEHVIGAMVILGCESDFVAKTPQFLELAHDIAMQVASMDPKDVKELLAQTFIKDQDQTIQDLVHNAVGKIGENIKIVEFKRYSLR